MHEKILGLENQYIAKHYNPLPIVISRGKGIYVWDVQGKRYIDCLSAYSALNGGHCHPKLIQALVEQAGKLTLTSRAFYHDQLCEFIQYACTLTGQDKGLPMNTGVEAVETAIKAARKWAYTVKGVPTDCAEIIFCNNNFHGRTTTVVSASSTPGYKAYFGPPTPGFKLIPYGDIEALKQAITPHTAAFLVEPIQGEGGIVVPPEGYLKSCEKVCRTANVLFILDEIQTGLGRTGALLACNHESVVPDAVLLGKSLGGGMIPVSLFLSKASLMDVFVPGEHGSTFGGNPLAAQVGLSALKLLMEEGWIDNAKAQGRYLLAALKQIQSPFIETVRGKGLLIGLKINTDRVHPRALCERFLAEGLLVKDTQNQVVRLSPPLIITRDQIDNVIERIRKIFERRDSFQSNE